MNQQLILATKTTPLINFNGDNHYFLVEGRSLPENTRQFYEPVLKWLESYSPEEGSSILIEFKFDYINSTSLIAIFSIVKSLKAHLKNGCSLKIIWFYEEDDEDLLAVGEDIANLSEMKFEYIESK